MSSSLCEIDHHPVTLAFPRGTMFTISQTQRPAWARKEIQWHEAGQVRTVASRQVCALTGEDRFQLMTAINGSWSDVAIPLGVSRETKCL